jgi:hypothetical protein
MPFGSKGARSVNRPGPFFIPVDLRWCTDRRSGGLSVRQAFLVSQKILSIWAM